jgi:hypothetical protein
MIRRVVIVILSAIAMGSVVLWTSSYWYAIVWCNEPNAQLPVVAMASVKGRFHISRTQHLDSVPRDTARTAAIGGVVLASLCVTEMLAADDPAGFTIRRVKPMFDENGRSPFFGDLRFVPLKNVGMTTLIMPFWFLFVVFVTYPAVAFIRGLLRRWRRRRRGLCVRCGYNLTGLTEPRCPECGGQIPCIGSGE